MSITTITTDFAGQISVTPRLIKITCTDNLSTVTTAGYLNSAKNEGFTFYPNDMAEVSYSGGTAFFNVSISGQNVSLIALPGSSLTPGTSGNLPEYSGATGGLADSGIAATSVIVASNNGGQSVSASTSSDTPGTIRALLGAITGTGTTMTSGNLVGVRGSATVVGASGGFIYGAQGKVIASGTLSGSVWAPAVFGQYDISTATINAGQLAPLWGDFGATSGTISDATGVRATAVTNTTAMIIHAQDYRYGNSTYYLELAGAGGTLNYYAAAGTGSGSAGNSTHCAAQQVIKILINGVAAYIPVFTQNS